MVVADAHHTEIGILCCEWVICDFGIRSGKTGEQGTFSRVRFPDQANIRDQFQFKNDITLFARDSFFELSGSTIGRSREMLVSASAFSPTCDGD